MRHLRLALRTLRRTPIVTAVAVLSLALGIGANAAIYSLFNELLLAPLPVPHAEQLVRFGGNDPSPGSHSCGLAGDCQWVFSYRMFRDLEAAPGPFTGVAAHVIFSANVAFKGQTLHTSGELVSGSYFPVLELQPALGRLFTTRDDDVVGAHPLVVLSHAFWQTQLGADPSVIGQRILVNGQSLTILGVAPASFTGTTLGNLPDVYVPLTMRAAMVQGWTGFDNRQIYWAYVFARLKPGVSRERAGVQENVRYHSIINTVEAPQQTNVSQRVMARFKAKTLVVADGRRGDSTLHEQTKAPLALLFGITLIVLVIACANIANLLLARAAARSLEMAVRLSLGATRAQVLAQLLGESVLLAVFGGAAGLAVAWATLHAIVALLPADVASSLSFSLSASALAFAGLLSIATGLAFGIVPALHSTRPDLVTTLRENSGKASSTRGAARFRASLVTAQIALSMALLVSAGLFIKSLANVSRVDLGMQTDDIVTFRVAPVLNGYAPARSSRIFAQIEDEVGAIPGVRGVAAARVAVLAGNNWDNDVTVQGFPRTPDTDVDAYYNAVGPGFFHLFGLPVVSGREFTASDVSGAPQVAVVNEAFAKKFGLGRDAVDKMMGTHRDSLDIRIVGLVKNAHYSDVKQELRPIFYLPYKQDTTVGSLTFYVRTALPPETIMPEIRATVARIDRTLPMQDLKTLPQQVRDNVYMDRMISTLSAGFAALATLLAAIGLYGVLAYSVVQRTREIGVRMALGADAPAILRMVLRQVATMTVVGAAVGAAAAYGIGRAASSLLYQMHGRDPSVMIAAAVLLAFVALTAGALPALRAARVDPTQALRQ